jgi:hypothetical protein
MKLKVSRRHLLKGSLAAPLVLTVRSASATGWAMSSAGACRVRDKDRAYEEKPYKFTNGPRDDDWLRCEVDHCKLQKQDKYGHWKDLDDHYYFRGRETNHYWRVSGSGSSCEVTACPEYTQWNCRPKSGTVRKKYALCRVDDHGNICGYEWETHHGGPISCSCWSSLKLT